MLKLQNKINTLPLWSAVLWTSLFVYRLCTLWEFNSIQQQAGSTINTRLCHPAKNIFKINFFWPSTHGLTVSTSEHYLEKQSHSDYILLYALYNKLHDKEKGLKNNRKW